MRLLADENIPRALVTALRMLGHDVVAITELVRGSADVEVARRAGAEGRIIITFDKDFGELAVRHGLRGAAGVILLRFVPERAPTTRRTSSCRRLPGSVPSRAGSSWSNGSGCGFGCWGPGPPIRAHRPGRIVDPQPR